MRGRDPFDVAREAMEDAARQLATPSPALVWDALSVALGVDARQLAADTVTALRCPRCRMVPEGIYACCPEHGAAILTGTVLRAARGR